MVSRDGVRVWALGVPGGRSHIWSSRRNERSGARIGQVDSYAIRVGDFGQLDLQWTWKHLPPMQRSNELNTFGMPNTIYRGLLCSASGGLSID